MQRIVWRSKIVQVNETIVVVSPFVRCDVGRLEWYLDNVLVLIDDLVAELIRFKDKEIRCTGR